MPEFEIEFRDVPAAVQGDILKALRESNPSKECVENNSFRVILNNNNGRYSLSCKQRGGPGDLRLLPAPIDETEPSDIAKKLMQLTES